MKSSLWGFAPLLLACGTSQAATAQPSSASCDIHFYPADGLHSVGEDFDAVKRLDQDLRDHYQAAGADLNWLSTGRQRELAVSVDFASLLKVEPRSRTDHPGALSRRQAIAQGPRTNVAGCLVEMMVPQIFLERGGLAARSLRVFGAMRRYHDGVLVKSYSGYADAPLVGFKLKSPADAAAATALIERAYVQVLQSILWNAGAKAKFATDFTKGE